MTRAARYVRDKFGPARWRRLIADPLYTAWDFWLGLCLVASGLGYVRGIGPIWSGVPIVVLWILGHLWARRRLPSNERERDLLLYGTSIEVDGKRIDPARVTFYTRRPR